MKKFWDTFKLAIKTTFWQSFIFAIYLLSLCGSVSAPGEALERIRYFTRPVEFNYIAWMTDAMFLKNTQAALDIPRFQQAQSQQSLVRRYMDLVRSLDDTNGKINGIFADPDISDPRTASADLIRIRNSLLIERERLEPISESILQHQTSDILKSQGLTLAGQAIPPILFRVTPLPLALIISPRNIIRQEMSITLLSDLTIEQISDLEQSVEKGMDVSALVVEIGGLGLYPTMVNSTSDLTWLTEVVAHEWTHNFLTLRPLGINYETTPELRTMNETTASIAGKEIGRGVLSKFYPDLLPPAPVVIQPPSEQSSPQPPQPPVFDFRAEMHITRVEADRLLAEGKIAEAESLMESRRRIFLENGYLIRRLNQAYFAFNGAYADEPGGAAGKDPVGPAVRELRRRSPDLLTFINKISVMTSFEELQQAVSN